MPVTSAELIGRLVDELGYPAARADAVATELAALPPPVDAAFEQWWSTGAPPTVEVAGYTVERLGAEHGMTPIAALLTLGWLVQDPERALASLRRGHDHVRPPHGPD